MNLQLSFFLFPCFPESRKESTLLPPPSPSKPLRCYKLRGKRRRRRVKRRKTSRHVCMIYAWDLLKTHFLSLSLYCTLFLLCWTNARKKEKTQHHPSLTQALTPDVRICIHSKRENTMKYIKYSYILFNECFLLLLSFRSRPDTNTTEWMCAKRFC